MRKIQLILIALVMFQFACEPPEDMDPALVSGIDYDQVSDGFHKMFEGALSLTESQELISVVGRNQNHLTFRYEAINMSKSANRYFSTYFHGTHRPVHKLYLPRPGFDAVTNLETPSERLNDLIDTSLILTDPQKMYIKSLTSEIMKAQNQSEGLQLVTKFKERVANSRELSARDKIILLEMAAGSKALLEFIAKGGIQKTQKRMLEGLGNKTPVSRTMECYVDWRSIWMDGVVGLVGGAVWGGYIGGTAGTFTVPVLGTAVGAVGGAVFGGASGFISGVSYGVVSDLLTTCFRSHSLQQTFATCDQAWEAYMNNEIAALPVECFEVSISIKSVAGV